MKRDYDAILIIPNEKKTNGEVYFEKLIGKEKHNDKEFDFVKKYNIPDLSEEDLLNVELAALGHIVLEIAGNVKYLALRLPETITKRQRKVFNRLKIKYIIKKFDFYGKVEGFIIDKEGHIIGDVERYNDIMDFVNNSVDIEEIQNFKR